MTPIPDLSWPQAMFGVCFLVLQGFGMWINVVMLKAQSENHKLMNSRLSELQEATKISSHAAGLIDGIKFEQERVKGPSERLEEIRGDTK